MPYNDNFGRSDRRHDRSEGTGYDWSDRRRHREQLYKEPAPGIWGYSPPPPDEDEIISSISKSKKDKKRAASESDSDSSSDQSSDSSDDDRKRKSKKSKKRKHSKKPKKKEKQKRKKHKSKSKKKKKRKVSVSSSSDSSDSESEEDEQAKPAVAEPPLKSNTDDSQKEENEPLTGDVVPSYTETSIPAEEDDVVIGPLPPQSIEFNSKTQDFGGALLAGEGDAMAAYVADGKRIPRRGEIGLTSDEISSFENEGYVMSGSRHRRMEAVRVRKENQIYSADERRALAMFHWEERQKRENKILSGFKEILKEKGVKDD
eukprot:m.8587 g.8587  ORF g.8587 m.8587 type:complete len:316 (-) comp3927_c0_seq1:1999-2946(-)